MNCEAVPQLVHDLFERHALLAETPKQGLPTEPQSTAHPFDAHGTALEKRLEYALDAAPCGPRAIQLREHRFRLVAQQFSHVTRWGRGLEGRQHRFIQPNRVLVTTKLHRD